MLISAALLAKRNCKSIYFARLASTAMDSSVISEKYLQDEIYSGMREKGNKEAEALPTEYQEMGAVLHGETDSIAFSVDAVFENTKKTNFIFIENKMRVSKASEEFLRISMAQTALYHALLHASTKRTFKSAFFTKKNLTLEIDRPVEFYLKFGKEYYKLIETSPKAVLSYYKSKAVHSRQFRTAHEFDVENRDSELTLITKELSRFEKTRKPVMKGLYEGVYE